MYSVKKTEIITFLLTWLLTYDLLDAAATGKTEQSPSSPRPSPRNAISVDPCSMVYQFAKDEAAFSTCAITSANNMCKKCVTQINMLTNSYTKLIADDNIKRISDSRCLETIVTDAERDRFRGYYSQSRQMWYTNNCDNCFMESSQELRHDVQNFFSGASDFDTCLDNNPNDTCGRCTSDYSSLNSWYEKLEDDYNGNVCLDVTAVMVNFRNKWFSLGCISPVAYDVIVIVIGCSVISACLLMYLISRRFSQMVQPGLLMQKRLSMFTRPSDPKSINSSPDEQTHLLSGSVISWS